MVTFKEYMLLNEDIITGLAPLSDLGNKSPYKVADILKLVSKAKTDKASANKAVEVLNDVLNYIYKLSHDKETSATTSIKKVIEKIKSQFAWFNP